MDDLRKDFEQSFGSLKRNTRIVLPFLFSTALILLLIFLFLSITGIGPLFREMMAASAEFEKQKKGYLMNPDNIGDKNYTLEMLSYIGRDSRHSKYDDQMIEYLDESGFDFGKFAKVMVMKNLVMLIAFVIIGIAGSIYFSSMSYAIVAMHSKKESFSAGSLLRLTNRNFFRLIVLGIFKFLIITAPLLLGVALVGLSFLASKALGIILIILLLIAFIFYAVYMKIRLLFAVPIMYIDGKGAAASLKESFWMTKGNMKHTAILFFILYGILLTLNSFVGRPLYESFIALLTVPNYGIALTSMIIVLVTLVILSFGSAFHHLFWFYSYLSSKKPLILKQNVKNSKGGKQNAKNANKPSR